MTTLLNLGLGILSGIISSYLFLIILLKNLKPKLLISNSISQQLINGENSYLIKFINTTGVEIFDVRIELMIYTPIGDYFGGNLQGKEIKLKENFLAYISKETKNDPHNLHAIRIRTTENIKDLWKNDSSFIRLTIIAKHSLSGINNVFIKDYLNPDAIISKKFISGNSLEMK